MEYRRQRLMCIRDCLSAAGRRRARRRSQQRRGEPRHVVAGAGGLRSASSRARSTSLELQLVGCHVCADCGKYISLMWHQLKACTAQITQFVHGIRILLVWGYIADLSMVPRLRRGRLASRALRTPFIYILRGQNYPYSELARVEFMGGD